MRGQATDIQVTKHVVVNPVMLFSPVFCFATKSGASRLRVWYTVID